MQRRTSALLLLKQVVQLAPKRPMDGMGGGAGGAAAAATAASAHPAAGSGHPTTPPPRQPFSAAPPSPARPATLVTPPASHAAGADSAAPSGGLRKKKIIRRIVKRKKVGGSAPPAAATTTTTTAAPAESMASPAAAVGGGGGAATGRAQAMLHEIRKQPEGAIEDAENTDEYSHQHDARSATTAAPAAAAAEDVEEEGAEAYTPTAAAMAETEAEAEAPAEGEKDATAERYAEDMQALHDETDESAGTTTSTRKTAMVKGYRIDEVSNLCSASDAMFARRLPSGGCQFFAWPGTPLPVASKAILTMPDTIRTVHAVFGRPGTPMDIVMDIDCQVPQEYWTMTKIRPFQQKLLDDVLSVLKEEIEKIGESIETQVVLQSPNLKKASFHIHTKLKDAAFADFNSLHGFLSKFQDRLPNVDMQIYRPHGMLRMYSCMKENHTSAIVVFDDPKWNIGFPNGKVSDEQAALHSACVRDPATFTRTLTFASPRQYMSHSYNNKADGTAADGEERRFPPQVRLPLTEREAITNASRWLRNATEVEVGEWRSWIGLGLCAYRIAYQFRNAKNLPRPAMEEMLDAWTEASRKCPLKFHQGECESRWAGFSPEKLGDHSDWWGAYKRLGRLENGAMEAAQLDAEEAAARLKRPSQRKSHEAAAAPASSSSPSSSTSSSRAVEEESAATSTPAAANQGTAGAPSSASGSGEKVVSASRKLKLKKRSLRH